jgi:cell division protein ZapE
MADNTSGLDLCSCLQRWAARHGLTLDASQRAAAGELQRLQNALLQQASRFRLARLLRRLVRQRPVRGIYLWGAVGRGKSFVLNAFFSCIPLEHKRRLHFHHFMREIHARLAALKGQADPLEQVAREISQHVRLLCLDEFHITDITDAMLMRGLLQGLLDRGVAVVVTSNAEPEALYRNGLQRERFLPTIALIRERLEVVHFAGGVDYRLGSLEQAGIYHTPLDNEAERALHEIFLKLAGGEGQENVGLHVEGRTVRVRRHAASVAWFDFGELCAGPRSKADYIELAKRFHTIVLSGVQPFDQHSLAQARRFLWMLDEFYDRRVKLILSATAPLAQLGPADLLDGEFQRALSRLAEMQTQAYLAQAHQPQDAQNQVLLLLN